MSEIILDSVTKFFKNSEKSPYIALKDISFTIEKGEFVVIIGESGCGKSTLLNLIAGLTPPSEGTITVSGKNVKKPEPSRILMLQNSFLLPWLTVKENIIFGCKLRHEDFAGGEKESVDCYLQHILEEIGLSDFADSYPHSLSVGMAQRVAFARSIISNPSILLLDESFSSLDFFNYNNIINFLQELWRLYSFTCVYVTHDFDKAIRLATKIILLGDHPGAVKTIIDVDIPFPRDPDDPDVFNLKNKINQKIRDIHGELG